MISFRNGTSNYVEIDLECIRRTTVKVRTSWAIFGFEILWKLKKWSLRAAKPAVAPVDPDISSQNFSTSSSTQGRAIVTHAVRCVPNYSLIRSISSFWRGPFLALSTWAQKFHWIVTFTVTQSHLTTTFVDHAPSFLKSKQIRLSLKRKIYERNLTKIISDILTYKRNFRPSRSFS